MSSIQKRILDAMVAALNAGGAPAKVTRTRVEPFVPEELPAINVFPGEETPQWEKAGNEEYRLTWPVRVECIVSAQAQVDVAADPLRVWAQQQLMADRTLGGLVEDCRIARVFWEIPENKSDVDVIFLVLQFDVNFATLAADPTTSASYGEG